MSGPDHPAADGDGDEASAVGGKATRKSKKRALFPNPDRGATVIGVAVSFPDSDSDAATDEYVTGSAGTAPR